MMCARSGVHCIVDSKRGAVLVLCVVEVVGFRSSDIKLCENRVQSSRGTSRT